MKENERLEEYNYQLRDSNQILIEKNKHVTDSLTDNLKKVNSLEKKLKDYSKKSKELKSKVQKLESENKKLKKQASVKGTNSAKRIPNKVASTAPSKNSTTKQKRTLTMVATAYTASCAGCSGVTATGVDLRKNPGMKVIAVDPSVIPLGSKVHVEGYGYAVAGDTGGAIKGNKIDIFIPNRQDALAWGVRTVKVSY